MPAKKKPTMLQRQRALRKQQQQTKQQSQRQLPPGNKGGSVDKPKASKSAPPRSNQPVERVRVRDLGSTKPKPMSGGTPRALPPGNQGGQLARVARTAATTAGKVGAAGKVLPVAGSLLTAAGEVRAMADRQKRWDDYKKRTGLDKKTEAQTGGSRRGAAAGTRAKPTSALQGRVGNANVNDLRRGQEEARKAQLERANRGQRSTTQSGGGSTQSRGGGGGSSRPAAPRPQSGPASNAGMKNQDPKYRGNLFEKTFGYKKGEAPDQQKSRFKSVSNKFGQDSGYEPKNKVDGSKYADKKPDMKKVKEYDRLRRKYYD